MGRTRQPMIAAMVLVITLAFTGSQAVAHTPPGGGDHDLSWKDCTWRPLLLERGVNTLYYAILPDFPSDQIVVEGPNSISSEWSFYKRIREMALVAGP